VGDRDYTYILMSHDPHGCPYHFRSYLGRTLMKGLKKVGNTMVKVCGAFFLGQSEQVHIFAD
jgi:hypothetical protein